MIFFVIFYFIAKGILKYGCYGWYGCYMCNIVKKIQDKCVVVIIPTVPEL